jgi:hypothetical protein
MFLYNYKMDQKKKIQLYIGQIESIHAKNPNLKFQRMNDFEGYEKFMSESLPRFKEDYKTLFKLAIREFDIPGFQNKLGHFLNITQSVINGKRTLEDATTQVAKEQYNEYVAPIVPAADAAEPNK